MHMCTPCACLIHVEAGRGCLVPWELELKTVVSHYVGPETKSRFSSRATVLLSAEPSPPEHTPSTTTTFIYEGLTI